MRQEFLCKTIWIFAFILSVNIAYAQHTAEESISETFDIAEVKDLNITNKYGDVHISKIQGSNIEIEYSLSAHKKTKQHALEVLDRIQIDMKEFGGSLNLNLSLAKSKKSLLDRIFSQLETGDDASDVSIDLDIQLPSDMDINIVNEFGNVYIEDWSGKLDCFVRHGDVRVTENLRKLNLTHRYGKANFQNLDVANLKLRNSDFTADQIEDLDLESKGSEIQITEIGQFNLDSKRDEIRVDKIERLKGELNYSTGIFKQVGKTLILNMKFSDIRIAAITDSQPDYFIEQSNSDIDINILNTSVNVKATMDKGTFKVPDETQDLNADIFEEEKEKRIITGYYGNGERGMITIKGRKGFILLRLI